MAQRGTWVIPGFVGLGMQYMVKEPTVHAYRIWNESQFGDLKVQMYQPEGASDTVNVRPGCSVDVEAAQIMLRRLSTNSNGKELKGSYERLD